MAQIGEKLASLIDMVSAKSGKDKGGKSKITKELLPLVSVIKLYNYVTIIRCLHMQETMHDIFDVEFAAEIEQAVTAKVWSELPKELVEKMIESAMNHIEMAELDPPPRKAIV